MTLRGCALVRGCVAVAVRVLVMATRMSRKRARSNEKLVPVAVIGFKGLKDRMDQQDRIVGQFTKMADQLASTLHEMELESEKSKDLISQLRHKHTLLSQRLIRVRSCGSCGGGPSGADRLLVSFLRSWRWWTVCCRRAWHWTGTKSSCVTASRLCGSD